MSSIRTISQHNHDKAWDYFVSIGKIPVNAEKWKYVLHHKDQSLKTNDPDRYHEWRIEDLEVMLHGDHTRLHKPRRHVIDGTYRHSEETKQKIRESMKGNKHTLGLKHTEESKQKMSDRRKGIPCSEETKQKIRIANKDLNKDTKWYNNGIVNVRRRECPEGFVPGRISRAQLSDQIQ